MIHTFAIKMQRTITLDKPKSLFQHRRIVSTITVELKGTYVHEALTNARIYLPGWQPIDWKMKP